MAASVGFCGLDRERRPLRGDEIRACWEPRIERDEAPAAGIPRSAPTPATNVEDRTPVRRLEFVEVGAGAGAAPGPAVRSRDRAPDWEAGDAWAAEASETVELGSPETRWSLWGDVET
ncbi:MAG TPA: hypothetical protein VF119_02260 [Candidatus Limnocylindrales bacterium]